MMIVKTTSGEEFKVSGKRTGNGYDVTVNGKMFRSIAATPKQATRSGIRQYLKKMGRL